MPGRNRIIGYLDALAIRLAYDDYGPTDCRYPVASRSRPS